MLPGCPLRACSSCKKSLRRGVCPPGALVSHNWQGTLPEALVRLELTATEWSMLQLYSVITHIHLRVALPGAKKPDGSPYYQVRSGADRAPAAASRLCASCRVPRADRIDRCALMCRLCRGGRRIPPFTLRKAGSPRCSRLSMKCRLRSTRCLGCRASPFAVFRPTQSRRVGSSGRSSNGCSRAAIRPYAGRARATRPPTFPALDFYLRPPNARTGSCHRISG